MANPIDKVDYNLSGYSVVSYVKPASTNCIGASKQLTSVYKS